MNRVSGKWAPGGDVVVEKIDGKKRVNVNLSLPDDPGEVEEIRSAVTSHTARHDIFDNAVTVWEDYDPVEDIINDALMKLGENVRCLPSSLRE